MSTQRARVAPRFLGALLCGLSLAAAARAVAQESWQGLDLFGGIPNSLSIDPQLSSTVYVAYPSGVYKSTDGGATWVLGNQGLEPYGGLGVAVSPSQTSTLYVTRGFEDFFRSTDAGASWEQRHSCPSCGVVVYNQVLVDPTDAEQLFFCDVQSGASASSDGGLTLLGLGPECGGQLHVAADGAAYAASATSDLRAERSTNGGQSWAPIGPAPDAFARGVATDPGDPQRIYLSATSTLVPGIFFVSSDGGGSWAPSGNGLSARGQLAVSAAQPATVYWYHGGAIYRSTDSGANFSPVTTDLPVAAQLASLSPDPANASTLWAIAYGRRLYKSTDAAATWVHASQGVRSGTVSRLLFDRATPAVVLAVEDHELYRSSDAGVSWALAMNGIPDGLNLELFAHPLTPGELFASSSLGFWRSTDAGASWAPWGTQVAVVGLAFHPSDPQTFYAASGAGVARTTDGGLTWTPVNTLLPSLDVRAVALDPSAPQVLYAATDLGLFKTTNGASWWEATGLSGVSVVDVRVDPQTTSRVFALSNSSLRRSEDGAASWQTLPVGHPVFSLTAAPGHPNVLYAVGNEVSRSSSSGTAWTPLTTNGLEQPAGIVLAVDPAAPARLLLGTLRRGAYALDQLAIFADGFESGDTSAWSATVP